MDGLRTNKISRLIQKELGRLFLLETKKKKGLVISVTEVRVSADLSIARVYLSIFPDERADEYMESIRKQASVIRYDLGRELGSQLRRIPELTFYRDKSQDYAQRIDELLGTLTPSSSEQE